jgi:hypothetical protein
MFMNHVGNKVATRATSTTGAGLVATQAIRAGETLVAFGGFACDRAALDALPDSRRKHSLQIDDDLFLAGPDVTEPGDLVNHSCSPNCGIKGSVLVVAMRDIAAGEEITYDYAMSDSQDYDEFECHCGAPECRGMVTGSDWLRPELQARYRGYFSTYLERRIANLVPTGAERRVFAYESVGTKGTRLAQFVDL